jgi:hypothetical protein
LVIIGNGERREHERRNALRLPLNCEQLVESCGVEGRRVLMFSSTSPRTAE